MRLALVALAALILCGTAAGHTIYVANGSTELSNAQVSDALPAFQAAIDQDFAPEWNSGATLSLSPAPTRSWQIELLDFPDCGNCAGFHNVIGGQPHAQVGVDGWQVTFTHELWEMLADPFTNRGMVVSPRRGVHKWYALEVADPVEADSFAYTRLSASGQPVSISDFVTEAWYRRGSRGPWDFTHATKRPLQVLDDGYQLWWLNGWQEVG